jgi:predicted DsbA family dithiol-disulfide isomerase
MSRYVVYSILLFSQVGLSLPAQTAGTNPPASQPKASPMAVAPVATIDGVSFTLADVERKRPSMYQARTAFYEAQRNALDQFIDDYLLERQAKIENVTVAELLERHVNKALPPDPTEDALKIYYEGIDTNESYEAIRDKILDHIRQRRLARAKTAYLDTLRKQSRISIMLAAPRTPISLKGAPVRGRADAPVVMVEYADYECPYCQQLQPALDKLLAAYGDKVAFAYKDAPLTMHAYAQKAAEAAHCAGAQGKYWEYHNALFASKQLDVPALKKQARELSLDGAAFDKCLDSGTQAGVVQEQFAEAQSLGLQGTPTIFINGRMFSGVLTFEKLKQIVEEELAQEPGAHQP